jgi:hypothetical protein
MVYVEKYFALIRQDVDKVSEDLSQPMPTQLRVGLEGELKRLQMLTAALEGELDKSQLHQLRANLRWARKRLTAERDPAKRRKVEAEVADIEKEIKQEVDKKDRGK